MKQVILLLLAITILLSCQKNAVEIIEIPQEPSHQTSLKTIAPDKFDWESDDYMPTPLGTTILSPFSSGVNTCFPNLYINDLKKADGWELAYNNFSKKELRDPLFFGLYNKYRGVLRMFLYVPSRSPRPSTYISHSISIYNGSSSLLNFTEPANGISSGQNATIATTVQPFQLAATGSWCAAEFEMCYDVNTANINNAARLQWHLKSVNISKMKIDGNSQGTISGTIVQQSSPPNMFNTHLSGALEGINTLKNIDLDEKFKKPIKKGLESLLGGFVKNIFSAISGGSSTTTYVNLKTQATYELTGSITEIDPISSPSVVIPGCKNQSSTTGIDANFKYPLGIVGLIGQPKVKGTYYRKDERYYDREDRRRFATIKEPKNFYLDKASYTIKFNPSIINSSSGGARIANYKEEIIGLPPYGKSSRWGWGNPVEEINRVEPRKYTHETGAVLRTKKVYIKSINDELTQEEKEYRGDGPDTAVHWYKNKGAVMIDEYLRISFDVIPNNGAPKCKIIKTFRLYFDGQTIDR